MDVLTTSLIAIFGVACGVLAGWFAHGARTTSRTARHDAEISARLATAEAIAQGLRAQLDQQGAQYRDQLAGQSARVNELLDRIDHMKAADAARAQTDGRVLTALAPVAEQLATVREQVTELERQRAQQHGELAQRLHHVGESEERLRATTESLASALRSNSTRGVWGEAQLHSVVEAAGLLNRVDFDLQAKIDTESGPGRPDMVVHLPGGKHIAVDAKVPFAAYLEATAIPASAGDAEGARRDRLIAQHVKALRDHITALGSRAYWTGLESSPELVIAFIPSEGLVSAALEADPSLMEFAFAKRVALTSPVTLWSVLKTVAFSWQQQTLTDDAKKLFDVSRVLHSRLKTAAAHIDKLGRSLTTTVADYNSFVGSMERSVLPSARKLASIDDPAVLGGFTEIEQLPRPLTSSDALEGLEEVRRRIAEEIPTPRLDLDLDPRLDLD